MGIKFLNVSSLLFCYNYRMNRVSNNGGETLDKTNMEERVIASYRNDENMMILVFAQWCVNNDLDPEELYKKAYSDQENNPALKEALALTVAKEEAGEISFNTLINVLNLFGNHDLAFVVTEEYERLKMKK